MQLIPPWAPNLHPMIVHFPIVLVLLAVGSDLVHFLRPRAHGLGGVTISLYLLAALTAASAYVSGRVAADTVFIPGMAHGLVDDHEEWALVTTVAIVLVAALQVGVRLSSAAESRAARSLLLALGLTTAVMIQQTAERGARLVFEQGVGVIPGPGPAAPVSND